MADYLSRACRLQLTTAMENLIRTAVFEISQIFEDSLHDHQVELARQGEEIAFLKVKLQRAELRLKEASANSETDQSFNPSNESPSVSAEPTHQSSSEIDIDVPDDWCVPLDSENVNKQENPCPSVRLKQFSIPLFPIPLKHEAFSKLEVSRLRPELNMDTAQTGLQGETKPKRKRGRPPSVKKVKDVLMNIKEESTDIKVQPFTRRMGERAKKQNIRKLKNTNTNKAQASRKEYCCRFCPKVFDTPFGLSVHERAHKKCSGCKRIFPFPSVLVQHKMTCKFYNKLKKSSNISPNKSLSKKNSSIVEKDSVVQIMPSVRKIKMFTCKCCLKKFNSRSQLMKHPCFISCQTCNKRLSSRMALAVHITKMHKIPADRTEVKKDMSWTKPLDETEDSREKNLSPTERVKELIKKCREGFKCLICKRVYTSKYTASEHAFIHTGDRPFKCVVCSKTFYQRNALSIHRRRDHGMFIRKIKICACSKRFFVKSKYKEHKLKCSKAGK